MGEILNPGSGLNHTSIRLAILRSVLVFEVGVWLERIGRGGHFSFGIAAPSPFRSFGCCYSR
jgi:hypothetical protein